MKYPAYNDQMELNGFKDGAFTVDLSAEFAAIPRSQSNQALTRNQLRKYFANNTIPAEMIQKFVNKAAQVQKRLETHHPVVHPKTRGMLVVSNLIK